MVKIRRRAFLVSMIVFVLLLNTAYAGSKLVFSDVDVKVGSKTSKNLDDGDTIDEEAEPSDSIEFRVEVQNNFTSAEDLDIEDITVEVTIEEIDDGDDLEEESSEFDLRAGRDKRVTLKFEVPLEVEEDTFTVLIHAEGDDENGTDHEANMRLKLDVDKENHLLKITRKSLSPAEVSCSRKNVQMAATVINIGNEDEEDVTVQVISPDFGIDLRDEVEELTAEPNEEESRFSKVYTFNVPDDAEAGSYPVIVRALYDDGRKKAEETATLTLNECISKEEAIAKKAEKEVPKAEEEAEEVEVITPITGRAVAPVVQPEVPAETVVTQESLLKSNTLVVSVIIAEVVAIIIGIVLVVVLLRRRAG